VEAVQLVLVTRILPSVYLSGYIFPIENMPRPVQWLTYLLPDRYYVNIIRGIILRNAGFRHLWPDALVLVIMGFLMVMMARKRYQKTT
jgi:ABC-2 type transport system permease protein